MNWNKWAAKAKFIKMEVFRKGKRVHKSYSDEQDIQMWVDQQTKHKRDVILLNSSFEILRQFTAPQAKDSNPRRKPAAKLPPILIQKVNNHAKAVIYKRDLPEAMVKQYEEAFQARADKPVEAKEKQAVKITKHFNGQNSNDE